MTAILALMPVGSQSTHQSMEDPSSGEDSQALILLKKLPPFLKINWSLCASMPEVTKDTTTKGLRPYLLTPTQRYLR